MRLLLLCTFAAVATLMIAAAPASAVSACVVPGGAVGQLTCTTLPWLTGTAGSAFYGVTCPPERALVGTCILLHELIP